MKVYGMEPERALTIIDSALIVGNVSPFQADFLRAKVYANSLEEKQLDKAIALCEALLQNDSTQLVNASAANNRSNVLNVLMDASRKSFDNERWLRVAIELSELNASRGMKTEALRMDAEIGGVLTQLGRPEEGLAKLNRTIRALDEEKPSIDRMDAGIIARKRKILFLEEVGRYYEMIPEAYAILEKLEAYERNPTAYAEDSFRLPPDSKGGNRARYCRFYRAQAQAYLARAYARITPPDRAKASEYTRLFEASELGHTFSGRKTIAPAWKALGEWDKLLSLDAELERRMGGDSLNREYANILKDRSDAAKARGNYWQALAYMGRYVSLQEKLSLERLETQAQECAARYHVLEHEKKLQETEVKSSQKDAIIIIVIVILLMITAFAYRSTRQRRAISKKNSVLVRMIQELADARDAALADTPKPDRGQFEWIDGTIRKEKLYANLYLQRQDIVERFGIPRHALNQLLSAYAEGMSFTAYINKIRMEDALQQLRNMPEKSIKDIAKDVGLTPANFRELFKHQYGMTPTEFKQNL